MKRIFKRMFSIIMAGTVAVSVSAFSAYASDYADMIKNGNNNNEVEYDGSAYVTDLDTANAEIKPVITIEKKLVEVNEANVPQTVNVSLEGSQKKYNSVGLHFIYDTRLTVISNEFGECITYNGNLCSETSDLGNGELFVANMGVKGKDGEDMWQITFRLPENAKPGDLYPIGIEFRTSAITQDCFADLKGTEEGMLMQAWVFKNGINNGFIKVVENDTTTTATTTAAPETAFQPAAVKSGDINGDGRITPVDASRVLMMFAELSSQGAEITPEMVAVYDIDGDGKITSVDASLVLAYCANLAEDPELTLEDFVAEMK